MGAIPNTMFSGEGVTPWHTMGTVVPGTLNAEEAYVASGLNYLVGQFPAKYEIPGMGLFEDPNRFIIARCDNGMKLGESSERYPILQNEELFQIAQAVTKDPKVQFITAGQLWWGKRVWVLCKLAKDTFIGGKDADAKVEPYFLIQNAHTGSDPIIMCPTFVRVVCENTLAAALDAATRLLKISHRGDLDAKIAIAQQNFGVIKDYQAEFEAIMGQLVKTKASKDQFETLITEVLYPLGDDPTKRQELEREKVWNSLRAALEEPNLANYKDTAYGLYNAVADFEDHGRIVKFQDAEKGSDEWVKAESQLFVRKFEDVARKDKAFEFCKELAGIN